MVSSARVLDAAQSFILSADRLRGLFLIPEITDSLLNVASIVTLRDKLGPNRPIFMGLIGCTGTGKSTLFNSLAEADISVTGWRAHNTSGPVGLAHHTFFQALNIVEERIGRLLLTAFERKTYSTVDTPPTNGKPNGITLVSTEKSAFYQLLLFDLPDINTTVSREEKLVALQLQPWLDAVIFLVDDETIYHRDYEYPAQLANEYQQHRLCVLNHRGRDRVELHHPDMQNTKTFFGVDTIYLLPLLIGKDRFDQELAFLQFKTALTRLLQPAPDAPLFKQLGELARSLVKENQRRSQVFGQMKRTVASLTDDFLAKDTTIPIENILPDDVIQVLRHLGLKRFAVSNAYQFLRRIVNTGSIKQSFQLSFGDKREQLLSHVLRPDVDKLCKEIRNRLARCAEKIAAATRQIDGYKSIQEIAPAIRIFPKKETDESLENAVSVIVNEFEKRCKELISSDTLAGSVKNDPLVSVFLAVALVADTFTLPGFGSWLLVPSAFNYLPLGKFEQQKRRFQRQIQDLIRQRLAEIGLELEEICKNTVLDESDSLMNALKTCSEYR
ncbi:MAG: hypothetical protein C4527_14335 [Candidatus Omnitrophota bacterium]|jgi:energy-coupling factor transporter ATP-binding protein EcfA2|nr:MAG: hypothetical protein C4527_14335 [Candidatus Omnitrophota bacterium]